MVGEAGRRIVVALEPRSNTMKLGVHSAVLAESLRGADRVFVHAPAGIGWDVAGALSSLGGRATLAGDYGSLGEALLGELRSGDVLVFMSNGGFGGLREQLTGRLGRR